MFWVFVYLPLEAPLLNRNHIVPGQLPLYSYLTLTTARRCKEMAGEGKTQDSWTNQLISPKGMTFKQQTRRSLYKSFDRALII
jgi:hypothetical protein